MADDEGRTMPQSQCCGITPRRGRRARQDVDADAGGIGQFREQRQQQASGPGAEVDELERRRAVGQRGERRLDQRLAVRPRIERVRRKRWQPVIENAAAFKLA